jgi:hypothetical protein
MCALPASAADPVAPVYMNWAATQNTSFLQAGDPMQYSLGVSSWQQDADFNRTAWIGNVGNNFVANFSEQTIYYIDYYGRRNTRFNSLHR